MQCGCFPTHIMTQGIDLVRGDIQLVPALIGHQEVIAFDPSDGTGHHALVFADSVLVMNYVIAGTEIFKESG